MFLTLNKGLPTWKSWETLSYIKLFIILSVWGRDTSEYESYNFIKY